jgi:hypothetical protein
MSHRDPKPARPRLNADLLQVAVQWLMHDVSWTSITWRCDCTWSARLLTVAALFWAWTDESTLGERFATARKIAIFLFPPQGKVAGTYQAFIKLLVRRTAALVALLQEALRERMRTDCSNGWLLHGFVLFGADGSLIALPRTVANQKAYAPARRPGRRRRKTKGLAGVKKADTPQLALTVTWHCGLGLPWNWRIGPSGSSERAHLRDMLGSLPTPALIAADAGFIGYELASAILAGGRDLLIRVGSNVRLLKKLGHCRESGGIVYLWPDKAAQRRQPPLRLRLVVSHNGKHPVYLVTSILSTTRLNDRQVIELYGRRWGIEVFYRSLKQTFQRRKLRSMSAEPARIELEWSLVGLWAMSFYALVQIQRAGHPPRRLSCAKLLRAFRRMLRDYQHPVERGATLHDRLCLAIIDTYRRQNKTNRDYPRKKQETPAGKPRIVVATSKQKGMAKEFQLAA